MVKFSEADVYSFVTEGRTVENLLEEQVGWKQISSLVCDDLANMFQSMGYHGFKRMSRYHARKEAEEARCLRKLIYDVANVRTMVNLDYSALPVNVSLHNIFDWQKTWYESNLKRLCSIMTVVLGAGQYQYSCWLQKAIDCQGMMLKDHVKLMQNIGIAGWDNGHHLMIINKFLHKKYKCKEAKKQHAKIK